MMLIKTAVAAALGGALFLTGCASSEKSPTARSGGGGTSPVAAQTPPKDRVLWEYRNALTALRHNQYDEAKRLLDDALLTIGSIYSKDKSARKARSFFSEESKKTFLGEPYERVMAYYYRGILYWMDGEPDNARACFRSAQLQDSDAENKEYSSDYVLLDYLDGLITTKLGGEAPDAFRRAQSFARIEKPPPYDIRANALFFLEFGQGPLKYATGEYNQELRIREGRSIPHSATVRIGDKSVHVSAYDDLNFQATTRGGRVMDHILANKAVFKTTTDAVGDAALIGGLAVAGTRTSDEAAIGLVAFGVLSKIVAATTTPAADTRTWDNLPQYLSLAAFELPPGQHTANVEFFDAAGHPLAGFAKTVTFTVPALGRDSVIFVSDHS